MRNSVAANGPNEAAEFARHAGLMDSIAGRISFAAGCDATGTVRGMELVLGRRLRPALEDRTAIGSRLRFVIPDKL